MILEQMSGLFAYILPRGDVQFLGSIRLLLEAPPRCRWRRGRVPPETLGGAGRRAFCLQAERPLASLHPPGGGGVTGSAALLRGEGREGQGEAVPGAKLPPEAWGEALAAWTAPAPALAPVPAPVPGTSCCQGPCSQLSCLGSGQRLQPGG